MAYQWSTEYFPIQTMSKSIAAFKPTLYSIYESRRCTIKYHYEVLDTEKQISNDSPLPQFKIEQKPTPVERRRRRKFLDLFCCKSTHTTDDLDDSTSPLNFKSSIPSKTVSLGNLTKDNSLEWTISSRSISVVQFPTISLLDDISYSPDFASFIRPITLPLRVPLEERHHRRRRRPMRKRRTQTTPISISEMLPPTIICQFRQQGEKINMSKGNYIVVQRSVISAST